MPNLQAASVLTMVLAAACSSTTHSGDDEGATTTGGSTSMGESLLPAGATTEVADGSSSSSSGGGGWSVDTDDTVQPPVVDPPDCDVVVLEPQAFALVGSEFEDVDAAAVHPDGSSVFLVGESIITLDPDGQPDTSVELDSGLHPTTLAGDGAGNLYIAGVQDVNVKGDVDAFIRRYVGTQLAVHADIDLQDRVNEVPLRLAAAPGYVALVTAVEFDPLELPDLEDFRRLDRMTASLELLDSEPLTQARSGHAIDGEGTVYLFETVDVLSARAVDGSTKWSTTTEVSDAVDISVGSDEIWVATRAELDGADALGEVRSFARMDGMAGVSLDFETEMLPEGELREATAAVAAHPCGGASLLTMTEQDGEASMALSRIESDGSRTTTSLGLPFVSGLFVQSLFSVSTAASGRSVAVFRSPDGAQPVGF